MNEKQKQYDQNRKNNVSLNFKVNKRTSETLERIAEQKGISRSEVCRQQLEGLIYQPPLFDKKDSERLIKELNLLGNNLNQVTKSLNTVAKYFQQNDDSKESLDSLFGNGYEIFQDGLANKIARAYMSSKSDEIFTEKNKESYIFNRLSEEEVELFNYWLEKNSRPMTKEEYERRINQSLIQALNVLEKLEENSEKVWELV